jgi:hypothetical protein
LWKKHVVYESRPHSVIITLGKQLYTIAKAASPIAISVIYAKQCIKVISKTGKFILFLIHSWQKVVSTSVTSTREPLFVVEGNGRDDGRVQREVLLTHWGTDALPCQEVCHNDR